MRSTISRGLRRPPPISVILFLIAAGGARAEEVWLPDGLEGRAVTALAVAPADPRRLYAGTQTGEVFRSEDAATSWTAASAGLPAAAVHELAVHPSDPLLVYAGTDQGLYRSADGGASWEPSGTGVPPVAVVAVAIDPTDPNVVFVSANELLDPNPLHVYKTSDGGGQWESVQIRGPGFGTPTFGYVRTLAFRPGTATVYAGWHDVVFFSSDGGGVWGLYPDVGNDVLVVLPAPFDAALIYIGTFSGGMARSVDRQPWSFGAGLEGTMVVDLAADPVRPGLLYAAAGGLVFRSFDHGAVWLPAGNELPAPSAVVVSPEGSAVRAGTADGVVRLLNLPPLRLRISPPAKRSPPPLLDARGRS